MTALVQGRLAPRREGDYREGPVAAATTLFTGALLMRNASGLLVEGQTATGLVGVGVAETIADNASGAAGDLTVRYRSGIYRMANSASTDEITAADVGKLCYAVDDQTVAKTDATSTRSPAGIVDAVDTLGVWVRFDEALTAALAA
ncbi:hypothetical protein LA6_003431 [Marinibacterium anthonyi]|nr:hypothetical protein LA6_003431 [Marinibacterium anthonyi]